MAIKKFRFFLASNIEKEEAWLTEMSQNGYHFTKYKYGFYYFEQDAAVSYVYQTDFRQDTDEVYFQLYKDAGWQHMMSYLESFHYFRTEADKSGFKKIYSDPESVAESLQRMMNMYVAIFLSLIAIQSGLFLMWDNSGLVSIISSTIVFSVILLYVFLLFSIKRKINYYRKQI
ncbi:DUF2812 domain-containing protein [Oceanobacillus bengalensis]|uniref:DUF2812 domain-containing protein n=1 Tax=Oceanobacillus bengalensis TaxID=1435466 RepID=A0A494YU21_9BACI|nr:DUF2812 domain-containing protein [Oceanobacillus bengalensis]RKQ13644.1 DUF2812 domain-containing protein [Oceanobacillus bengalensis]